MKWGIERNTGAAAGAMFLLALGENLWIRFLPKYLEALGAPVLAIGAYGSTEDFLDAVYQIRQGFSMVRAQVQVARVRSEVKGLLFKPKKGFVHT